MDLGRHQRNRLLIKRQANLNLGLRPSFSLDRSNLPRFNHNLSHNLNPLSAFPLKIPFDKPQWVEAVRLLVYWLVPPPRVLSPLGPQGRVASPLSRSNPARTLSPSGQAPPSQTPTSRLSGPPPTAVEPIPTPLPSLHREFQRSVC